MTDAAMIGAPRAEVMWPAAYEAIRTEPTDLGLWAGLQLDADVPWWAVELLDIGGDEHAEHRRVRRWMREGHRPQTPAPRFWHVWGEVLVLARNRVMTRTLEEWIEVAYRQTDLETWEGGEITRVVRDAALIGPRSFMQFVDLRDDDGSPIVLKDFHVRTICAMRGFEYASILLPYEFGKSYLSNIVVPLMDWSEWCDATECRIYWNANHAKKWILRLMHIVEHNTRLHKLFPWVDKPDIGSDGRRLWGVKGFSIRGRTLPDKAFDVLTAQQYSTGNRYHRTGGDDWVNVANAQTLSTQEDLIDYWRTGPETMAQYTERRSPYGTQFPSVYLCGTLFSPYDVNNTINDFYAASRRHGDLRYKALRFDCFTRDERDSIWPEKRSLAYLKAKRESLTPRIFNMRCRNIIWGSDQRVFPAGDVMAAEWDGIARPGMKWGELPTRALAPVIGFDPGSGKITKESKNPAYFVYCRRDVRPVMLPGVLRDPRLPQSGVYDPAQHPDIYHHGVEWGRLAGFSFTQQCEFLIAIARRYGIPVAVEDNALQSQYAEQIAKDAPDVRMFAHRSGPGGFDPVVGVEQFEPLFKNGRMILHCEGAPIDRVQHLRTELVTWKGRFTDIVMAMWIARRQSEEHFVDPATPQLHFAEPRGMRWLRARR